MDCTWLCRSRSSFISSIIWPDVPSDVRSSFRFCALSSFSALRSTSSTKEMS